MQFIHMLISQLISYSSNENIYTYILYLSYLSLENKYVPWTLPNDKIKIRKMFNKFTFGNVFFI